MAACRGSDEGDANNLASHSSEPSDDTMAKTVQFCCLNPVPVKTTVQSCERWGKFLFPEELEEACVPWDMPAKRGPKLCG